MAKVKTHSIFHNYRGRLGYVEEKLDIQVNADGEFYLVLPARIKPYFEVGRTYHNDGQRIRCANNRVYNPSIYSTSMQALIGLCEEALNEVCKPDKTEELVIRYNISSHVSFALTADGEIIQNAGMTPDAEWLDDRMRYGNLHATNPSRGGYSLTIGAGVFIKETTKVGGREHIQYHRQQGAKDSPTYLLNSWLCFSLPDGCKEIPYSDDAALFFNNLLMGMAKLSKLIQDATFEEEHLLKAIESTTPLKIDLK